MYQGAGGFLLAPCAHAAIDLDIMSEAPGLIGAEPFAAVAPASGRMTRKPLGRFPFCNPAQAVGPSLYADWVITQHYNYVRIVRCLFFLIDS